MVRISAFQADGPGSIPGRRILFPVDDFIFSGMRRYRAFGSFYDVYLLGSVGLVVMTSALHAEGPQFNPGTEYLYSDRVPND